MLLVNSLLFVSALTGLFLGLFIYMSNPNKPVNRTLAAFQFGVFLWLFSNFLTNLFADPQVSIIFAKLTLFGATLLPLFFVLFSRAYVNQEDYSPKNLLLLGLLPFLILLTLPTKYNIESIGPYGQDTQTGLIYFVLTPYILIYFFWGYKKLLSYYKTDANAVERTQIRYMITGIVLMLVPSIVANAILPSFGYYQAILYGPNAVVILAVFMTVAIVKHRLLDIRGLVARSLAYVLLFATAIGLYGILTFYLIRSVFGSGNVAYYASSIIGTILIVFTLNPLRAFFDRLTNKYFYQDAYDPQEFLDSVNKILVGQIQLETLLQGITNIIESNIKTTYSVFVIRETAYEDVRVVGTKKHDFDEANIGKLRKLAPTMHQKIIIADDLADTNKELAETMRELDISVLVRLVSNTSLDIEGMGYLVLGPKKSGTIYSGQDKRVLDILSNEMVIAVENALRFEEIQKFNVTLQEKIDDATKRLRKTNEKLKALDETKDEFISMASHQLRTPLTSVKGYLSMVLEGDTGDVPEMQRKLLDQAFISSQRMVYLIADLLNVSRLRTGKFVIEPVPTNLAEVVEDEVSQLKETAKSRNLELIYDKPPIFPTVPIDETKIRQVVMNFLDNAIYYTPSGGHIKVEVKDTDKTIEYTVTDDGIGIPKWDQVHMFTKFYRAGNAKKARPDGTGLGLFMAKKVVVTQGGSIIFRSKEGKGSTFGFAFEKAKLEQIAKDLSVKDEVTHPKPTEVEKQAKETTKK